jgi:hypothetical protein
VASNYRSNGLGGELPTLDRGPWNSSKSARSTLRLYYRSPFSLMTLRQIKTKPRSCLFGVKYRVLKRDLLPSIGTFRPAAPVWRRDAPA